MASRITSTGLQSEIEQEIYRDIPMSFNVHPITGNMKLVANAEAIKQSVKNKYFTIVDSTNDTDKELYVDEFGRVFILNSKRKAPTEKKKYIPYFLLDDSTPDF